MLDMFPVFKSLFLFSDADGPPIFTLPDIKEFRKYGGLQLVKTLIDFTASTSQYILPSSHGELLSLVRLADFLGVDEFMEVSARALGVSVDAISNHNPVRKVLSLIRGRYRASRHNRQKLQKKPVVCGFCHKLISLPPPSKLDIAYTSCCNMPVHGTCKAQTPMCSYCFKQFRVLPCVICHQQISPGIDVPKEYEEALPHRTPCCKADCHPQCKRYDWFRCPQCQNPLYNWEIDKWYDGFGDVLAAIRGKELNEIRRRDNLNYDDFPVYRPVTCMDPMWGE